MQTSNLLDVSTHFKFGQNWQSFSETIDKRAVENAEQGVLKLLPREAIAGRTFLDIGCGSGLHSLAALRLGASRVLALDIDPTSVETTRAVLSEYSPTLAWDVMTVSIFDARPTVLGRFDVVYSWGVLHHTGNMRRAIEQASAFVAPGGLFAFALYQKTKLDKFWKAEKRLYAHAPTFVQSAIRFCYTQAFRLALTLKGRSFRNYVANYRSFRGMDFAHDVHDWLGGYPYEAATAHEVECQMSALGFEKVHTHVRYDKVQVGWLGSGCDEFVYRKCQP